MALTSGGRPVVIALSSEMCGVCLAVKPAARHLASQLGTRARIVELRVLSNIGRVTARALGVEVTPTFVTFDASGNEIARGQFPPRLDLVLSNRSTSHHHQEPK